MRHFNARRLLEIYGSYLIFFIQILKIWVVLQCLHIYLIRYTNLKLINSNLKKLPCFLFKNQKLFGLSCFKFVSDVYYTSETNLKHDKPNNFLCLNKKKIVTSLDLSRLVAAYVKSPHRSDKSLVCMPFHALNVYFLTTTTKHRERENLFLPMRKMSIQNKLTLRYKFVSIRTVQLKRKRLNLSHPG